MKFIVQILLILLVVTTISICVVQPDMHKSVMVYDSAYTPVAEQDVKTEVNEIPVMEKSSEPVQKTVKTETEITPQVTTTKKQNVNTVNKVQTTPKPKTVTKQNVSKPVTQNVKKPVTAQTVKSAVTTQTTKLVEKPKTEKIEKVTTPPVPTVVKTENITAPKVLTQQEETIAWNVWRSNLTNKIMQDTKMPDVPNGTLFHFSFNVDKYGKITNVQTGATPSNYTPYAIQYIAPVIRSYQGRSILNFPEGTARTSTTVTGKWRISNTSKFSTPQDYNDVERVTRY